MQTLETIVSVGQPVGKNRLTGHTNLPNITLQKARFFGRPNFAGEEDRFGEDGRKFTVLIPTGGVDDQLRQIGYNVKTNIPTAEELLEFPDREEISHLKVSIDDRSDVWLRMGEGQPERLALHLWGIVDKSRIQEMDMELRAWMYNEKKVAQGLEEPKYSARLVKIYVTIEHNILDAKYGNIG